VTSFKQNWIEKLNEGKIPYELDEVLPYFICAYYFGWKPEEVDEIDADIIEKLIGMVMGLLKIGVK
jgi:hypothetical protein